MELEISFEKQHLLTSGEAKTSFAYCSTQNNIASRMSLLKSLEPVDMIPCMDDERDFANVIKSRNLRWYPGSATWAQCNLRHPYK